MTWIEVAIWLLGWNKKSVGMELIPFLCRVANTDSVPQVLVGSVGKETQCSHVNCIQDFPGKVDEVRSWVLLPVAWESPSDFVPAFSCVFSCAESRLMFVSVVATGFLESSRFFSLLCFGIYIDVNIMKFFERPPLLKHPKLRRGVGICFVFSYRTWEVW